MNKDVQKIKKKLVSSFILNNIFSLNRIDNLRFTSI